MAGLLACSIRRWSSGRMPAAMRLGAAAEGEGCRGGRRLLQGTGAGGRRRCSSTERGNPRRAGRPAAPGAAPHHRRWEDHRRGGGGGPRHARRARPRRVSGLTPSSSFLDRSEAPGSSARGASSSRRAAPCRAQIVQRLLRSPEEQHPHQDEERHPEQLPPSLAQRANERPADVELAQERPRCSGRWRAARSPRRAACRPATSPVANRLPEPRSSPCDADVLFALVRSTMAFTAPRRRWEAWSTAADRRRRRRTAARPRTARPSAPGRRPPARTASRGSRRAGRG